MKAIFYTNACIEIVTSSRRILCDPWLVPGAYGTWLHHPPIRTAPEDLTEYTDIYISHIHEDHFCKKTLKRLPKKAPVHLCHQRTPALKKQIEALGLPVIEHEPGKWEDDMLFHSKEAAVYDIQDTAMVVRDGDHAIYNANDELPSYGSCDKINEMLGHPVDVAFMPFSAASDHPSSRRDWLPHEKTKVSGEKQRHHLEALFHTINRLKPKLVIPFAGSYRFGPPVEAKNEFLGVPATWEAAALLRAHQIPAMAMQEGEVVYTETDLERLTKARHRMWKAQEKYGIVFPYELGITAADKTYTIPMDRDVVEDRQPKAPCAELVVPKHILNRCLDGEMHWNAAQLGGWVDVMASPEEMDKPLYQMLYFLHL